MKNILEHFKMISATPRCSFKADSMREKIISFAKNLEFSVHVDKAGNVLCQKGSPRICLQAHYDMVCLGESSKIELIQKGDILKAKNSTLGADNGMGMAIMFSCMEQFSDIEFLFTSDEEVGLIGASHLELELASCKLLNLDGEEESDIYIGCAGGIDIVSKLSLEFLPLAEDEKIYEISVKNLAGGHSGVDIDKGIDSAIKVLAEELVRHDVKLLHVQAGEVRNSIPKNAIAIIASKEKINMHNDIVKIKNIEYKRESIKDSPKIIKALDAFAQGVREFDKEFMIPSISINMGVIRIEEGTLSIACAARAMENEDLVRLANQTESFFQLAGFSTVQADYHEPWMPNAGEFANTVKEKMSKLYPHVTLKAIHAGLECGILIQKQRHSIEAVAIGPTIRYPHSTREECDVSSVERIAKVVEDIIEGL